MSEQDVRARVEAFRADYEDAWHRAGIPPERGVEPDFAAWSAALAEVAAAHFVDGVRTGREGSMSGSCAHGPAEAIDAVEVDEAAGTAEVTSTLHGGALPHYYTYDLVRSAEHDDGWRIAGLDQFLDPPGTPLVAADEAARLLGQASYDAPLGPLEPDERRDPGAPFGPGASVVALGDLTTLGVLSVRDYGYGHFALEPLARRVPPGTYAAEVAVAEGVNTALRLILSDSPTTSWHPAAKVSGNAVVGVDAANVAICDLSRLVTCGAQEVERHFGRHSVTMPHSGGGEVFAQLPDGPPDVVMVASGYGDGGYPVFWGAAADGTLTQLVVDFMVPGDEDDEDVEVAWRVGEVVEGVLVTESGPSLRAGIGRRTFTLSHPTGRDLVWRLAGPDGVVLVHSGSLGHRRGDGRVTYTWTGRRPPAGAVLVIAP